MPPRPLSLLIAAAVALVLPATALAKPGGASPNSPAKPGMVPSHKQKLTAPRCGLHEETDPVRVLRDQDRHDTKIEAKYALGAIGETITLTATLQLMDGETVAFKPVATIFKPQQTVTRDGAQVTYQAKGRHDPCVLPRAVPMVEAMVALVLCDQMLHARLARVDGSL